MNFSKKKKKIVQSIIIILTLGSEKNQNQIQSRAFEIIRVAA